MITTVKLVNIPSPQIDKGNGSSIIAVLCCESQV